MKHDLFGRYFHDLNQLQHVFFNCFIKRDYWLEQNQYELKIHLVRMRLMETVRKIRHQFVKDGYQTNQLAKMENIYETIFSLGLLRFQVKDHETFAVCELELKKLSQTLSEVFMAPLDVMYFSLAIEQFTDAYYGTLQVIAPQPIVFLFFLQNLIALRDALEKFYVG